MTWDFPSLTHQRHAPGGFAARLDPGSQPLSPSHRHSSIPTCPQPLLRRRRGRRTRCRAPTGAAASSSLPGSVPGKTVELSASYN